MIRIRKRERGETHDNFLECMHVIVLGHCYYAGLHRGVPRDHEGLEVEGGAPGRLHHTHQSTPGRRGSACKVFFTRYTRDTRHPQPHFIIVQHIQSPILTYDLSRSATLRRSRGRRRRLSKHATAFKRGCPSWLRGHPRWVSFLSF